MKHWQCVTTKCWRGTHVSSPGGALPQFSYRCGWVTKSRPLAQHRPYKVLIKHRDVVAKTYPELVIEVELHRRCPAAVLQNATGGGLLGVLGPHGERQFAESMLGSVAQQVAARADGPAVVVRPESRPGRDGGTGPVRFGLDGLAKSSDALAFAFEEASSAGMRPPRSWVTAGSRRTIVVRA